MNTKGDRLRVARLAAGFKSTVAAAERLGVSASTYRAHENGQNDFNEEQATIYGRAFGVSPAHLLFGSGTAIAPEPARDTYEPTKVTAIPIRGAVAAGTWLETAPFLDDGEIEEYIDGLAVPEPISQYTYGLRVRGTSINKIAPDGACLIVLDIMSGVEVVENDLVIVERVRDQGSLREVTAKRVKRLNGKTVLAPESTDPRWQDVIEIDQDSMQQDAEVRIVAKVKHVITTL